MPIRYSSSSGVPFGTSGDRPSNPQIGQTFYNGTLGVQEIYTSSGWLPATGANDFNVTLTGSVTTATFTKEYFSGAYTIASALLDSTYDIYVYDTAGNQVGYTKSPSLNATGNFNKIVIIGGTTGDLLSFSYKTTFTATSTTSQTTAGAFITSVTPTALNSIDDTATITGGNFASNVSVYFVGSDNTERPAKSIVRTSNSQLIVTRPDNFPTTLGTYKLLVENPGITRPTGSSLHILNNAVTAGTTPNWTTGTTLPEIGKNNAYTTTLVATDTEGTDIDYSIVSGTLPSGITLNGETGVLSGTYTGADFNTTNLVIRAVDTGGNTVDRTFRIFSLNPVWVTSQSLSYGSGVAISQQLSVTDDSSVTYALVSGSTLPAGLTLSSSGLLSGTLSGSSSYSFTIRATDSVGNYSDRAFTLSNALSSSSTGGLTVTSGGYKYHLFKTVGSDTFTAGGPGNIQILLVGGGGAGDNDHGGGGGAGGVLYHSAKSVVAGNYSINVGAGGLGNSGIPLNVGDSTFTDGAAVLTAFGGGRGSTTNADSGGSGGSGGGGGGANSGVGTRSGGASIQTSNNGGTGYGNAGGSGGGTTGEPGGGGGGAGAAGANSTSNQAGNGGNGRNDWASWLSAVSSLVSGDTLTIYNTGYIAGGGGGGSTSGGNQVQASGGLGGGGRGDCNVSPGLPGVANTGGGGGSHGNGGATGADGGSGVVIIRYLV